MTLGIYALTFKSIDQVYVGQSIDIECRVNQHRYLLSKNKHYNYKIQNQYIIEQHIGYTILESDISVEQLNNMEVFWINEFNSIEDGLNISTGGLSVGKGVNNPNSKYSQDLIIECFLALLDYTQSPKKLAERLNMSESAVSHISGLRQHLWLQDMFPKEYETLITIHKEHLRGSYQRKGIVKEYPPIKSPEGALHYVVHLSNFCREHKLHIGAICRVLQGTLPTYLGWKLA